MTAQQILDYAANKNNETLIIKFLPEHFNNFLQIWAKLPDNTDPPPYTPNIRWMRISPYNIFNPYGYDLSPYNSRYRHVDFTPVNYIFTRTSNGKN